MWGLAPGQAIPPELPPLPAEHPGPIKKDHPATFFIQKANEFKSGIWVEKEDRRVNAKSLLGVLSLGIVKGTPITLIADGSDEKEAVTALVDLVKDNFGE